MTVPGDVWGPPEFRTDLDVIDRSSGSRLLGLIYRAKPRFELKAPLVFDSVVAHGLITVPAGFVTDFASIPVLLWRILPPVGAYDRAAVVHDYLYFLGGMPRAQADRVLREAMLACGVDRATVDEIYDGVRLGGWWAWRQHRQHEGRGFAA